MILPLILRNRIAVIGAGAMVLGALVVGAVWLIRYRVSLVSVPPPPPAHLPPIATSSLPVPPQEPEVPPYHGAAVQELRADPKLLAGIPDQTHQKSRAELAALAERVAQNPRDTDSWMRVAFIKHFYSDDVGARDAYEYLNVVANGYALPFYNLANLYGYYLKEPAKAVPKYEAAMARDPAEISYYVGFAEFYRDVLGDRDRGLELLRMAEAKTPGSPTLWTTFAAFYTAKGNLVEAIRYYEKALTSSALGANERAAIASEVERLKRR